jgi:signal peptidase I
MVTVMIGRILMDDDITPSSEVVTRSKKKRKIGFLDTIIFGLAAGIILNLFFVDSYVVPSSSMTNTLQVKDYMVSVPALDNRQAPDRGTVVVFNPPASWGEPAGTVFVKRVIAVGGDTISCCSDDGKLLLNGEELNEDYIKDGVNDVNKEFTYTVPEGQVFVLGDNRLNSADSRYHPNDPFVPVDSILGQPKFVMWPLNRIHAIN